MAANFAARILPGALALAVFGTVGCGGTTPTSPSATPPAANYPSLAGDWFATNDLTVVDRQSNTQSSYGCLVQLVVREQTGGTFSGFVSVQGGNDKQCTGSFAFAAQMQADGAITSLRPDKPFTTSYCRPVSDATFSGTASSAAIRVQMKDRATCDYGAGPRDSDRTLTIAVSRRSSTS